MPKTKTVTGVDIGAHTLRAVTLRKQGHRVSVVRAGAIELGDLALLDESDRKNKRVAELLRFLLRQTRIRARKVAAGLAGREYFIKYLRVPPASPDKLRKIIEYEAADDPTLPSQQTTDFLLLDLPTKSEEFSALVAMAHEEALRRRLDLLREARLTADDGVTLDAVGLFYAYVHALDEDIYNDKTTLLVDIGAEHMDVVVQRNAKMLFIRNLTLGGQRFSEAVQEEYELPIKEAEELKLTRGAIIPEHFDVAAELDVSSPEARLSAALIEPAEAVYNTLQATIKYCMTQTRMTDLRIDEVVLSGLGARLQGLREFLAQRFHVPVTLFDPLQGVDLSPLSPSARADVEADAPGYAVALGLALRQLDDRPKKPITLLPEDVARRREFLRRDAYVYAAVVVFVLAFGAMFYSSRKALARAEQVDRIEERLVEDGREKRSEFQFHESRNRSLALQAATLQRLFDTGRRTAEVVAILKHRVPPQLRIGSMEVATQRPTFRPTRGAEEPVSQEPTTRLILVGTVAEKSDGEAVNLADAQDFVGRFLKSLEQEKEIFSNVEVDRYPSPDEPPGARTFKMTVTFQAPFYGGQALQVMGK
ncbi:MAG: type IV pilus assembly protein PilM [Planctomycetota bacterium]